MFNSPATIYSSYLQYRNRKFHEKNGPLRGGARVFRNDLFDSAALSVGYLYRKWSKIELLA